MKHFKRTLTAGLILLLTLSSGLTARAEEEYSEAALERQAVTIESNANALWPEGPVISASSAILMDADTGVILYAKDIHRQMYPASTTKLMTTLLAYENCDPDEYVTVSSAAIASVPSDGSRMGITAGEKLTVAECIYATMVQSANEIAYALGEHVAGSEAAFTEMMNLRAQELGCLNTNFENASGLNNDDHLTTAYDLALIGRAYFSHDFLAQAASTSSYKIAALEGVHEAYSLNTKNLLYAGKTYAYEGLVGSKTGYLSVAGQTLVSCAERDGMRLICVVLFEDNPYQYIDTVTLFDYGFENFSYLNISDSVRASFASMDAFLLSDDEKLLVPNGIGFKDLSKEMVSSPFGGSVTIHYTYNETPVGTFTVTQNPEYFPEDAAAQPTYVNVLYLALLLLGFAIVLIILTWITSSFRQISFDRSGNGRKKRRRFSSSDFDNYKF